VRADDEAAESPHGKAPYVPPVSDLDHTDHR